MSFLKQANIAGLLDELEKVALDPYLLGAATSGALGAGGLVHQKLKGKQLDEEAAKKVDAAKNDQELAAALKHQKKVTSKAETAGAGLISGGAAFGSNALANRVGERLVQKEIGQRTSANEVRNLMGHMGFSPEATGNPAVMGRSPIGVVNYLPEHGVGRAVSIPPGGLMPPPFNAGERMEYARKLEGAIAVPPAKYLNKIDEIVNSGRVIIPGNAGPHVAAHELGHAAFFGKPLGRLAQSARLPAMLAGGVLSGAAAAKDPDSTASKLAPVAGLAAATPMLGEEAYASLKGYDALKKAKYSPEALKAARSAYGKAFGTYALKYGLPLAAAPVLIRQWKKHQMKKRHKAGKPTSTEISEELSKIAPGE